MGWEGCRAVSGLGGLWGVSGLGGLCSVSCVCVCACVVWVWVGVGGCLTDTISTFNWYQRLVQNVGSPPGCSGSMSKYGHLDPVYTH